MVKSGSIAHALIVMTRFPSMPLPFSSETAGEAWLWDDFVLTVQEKPRKVAELMSELVGAPVEQFPLIYPYAVTVFYRMHCNPHGPSSQPVLVVALEKLDLELVTAAALTRGIDMATLGLAEDDGSVTRGMFTATQRLNIGRCEGEFTLDRARKELFSLVRVHLELVGEPEMVGPISAIYGHPETGWPAKQPEHRRQQPRRGLFSRLSGFLDRLFFRVRVI